MRKKLNKKELEESLHLFRATIKLSNALTNLDSLNDGECPFFEKKMKMDLLNFSEWIEKHVQNLIEAYIEENPDILINVMHWFTEIEDHLKSDDPYIKDILMFFCKIFSACNDLKNLQNKPEYDGFISPIISRSEKLLNKGYIKEFEFLNSEHDIFNKVVEQMDTMGYKVVI